MTSRLDAAREPQGSFGQSLHVPCPVLVGRASEMDVLQSALGSARNGRGEVVFVVGEAGIGKSRLVHEAIRLAEADGVRVMRGRAVPASDGAAFRALTEALAPAAAEALLDAGLTPWLPALAAVVPTVSDVRAVEATVPVRGEAIVRFLRSLCAPAGGLLVLEDLHWADPETVAIVEHLSDNLGRAPVLCVCTVRTEETSAAGDLANRVAARRSSTVLMLSRLNGAQMAAMVHGCTGGADATNLDRVVRLADGVPFLVEEMLASPGLPESFADGVRARLDELSEQDRRVLVAAAAFGRHFDWSLLCSATGLADDAVVDALDHGLAVQLLAVEGDGFRFRHSLTAEAVFQTVPPPRRQAVAAAALAALGSSEQNPGVDEVTARLAERSGDHDRAGRLHLAMGERALARGALNTAVVAFQRSVGLLSTGDEADLASERLVEALALAGRVDDALAVGDMLAGRLPAERGAALHLCLASAALTASRWPLAAEHLEAAGGLLEGVESPRLHAELGVCAGELAIGTNDTGAATRRAGEALELARRANLRDQECAALLLLGRCVRRASLEAAESWFAQALATAEAGGLEVWRLRALHEAGTIALLDRSQVDALVEARRLAESLGAMATTAVLEIEIAAGCAGQYDIDGQERHGLEAVRRGGDLGLDLVVAMGWQHVGAAATLRGDGEQAAAAFTAARSAAPGNRDIDGLSLCGEAVGALLTNDLDHALALLERGNEALRGSETAAPAYPRTAWPLLLALAGRPDAMAAVEELERAGLGVPSGGRSWLTLTRAVLAGRTDQRRAGELAIEADVQMAGMPLWRQLGRRFAAEAAAADGWELPKGWLLGAESWFRDHGYPAVASACRAMRTGQTETMPAPWVHLGITRREADVLELVVEGLSNREIAERLFLSVRTVEKHVESLLRKTATRTRTQLARWAGNSS
jgi:DNA-binding CsgD family transcriptional regulator